MQNNTTKTQNEINSDYIFLSDLNYITSMTNTAWGNIQIDKNINGNKITLIVDGEALQFDKGIGAHATSNVVFDVSLYSLTYSRFTTYLGIDKSQQDKGNGVKFIIYTSNDGVKWSELITTNILKGNQNSIFIDIDITGAKYLKLYANDNGSNGNDHAVYGNPRIMKANYDITSEYPLQIKTVSQYDELIKKNYTINDVISEEYEKLLLERTFIKRVGFHTLQHLAKVDEKYKNIINWLITNEQALKLYITGGEVEGSTSNSIKALGDIYELYKNDFNDDLYLKLAISTSLSHSKTIRLWTGNATPSVPIIRYKLYRDIYSNGLMAQGGNPELFKNLPIELMRWVTDNKIDDEEINWLIDNALSKKALGKNYLDAYMYITYTSNFNYNKDQYYDLSKYNQWNTKYNISNLTDYGIKGIHKLWIVFEEGSVCGGLAKTYANLAQCFGYPAAVIGQPGHAATLAYSKNSNGKGLWKIKNDVSGWTKSEKSERLPLGWGSKNWDSYYSVSYILLAQQALDDYDNLIKASYYNHLADVYQNDTNKALEIYEKALQIQSYNLDAIVGIIDSYKSLGNKTSSEYLSLATRIADALTFFPLPFIDTLNLIKTNVTDDSDKIIFDMLITKTLTKATQATENDTLQFNICKNMASFLLETNTFKFAIFSFDGEDAGKIKINDMYSSLSIRWQYSIDGWNTKVETNAKEVLLSNEDLKKINTEKDIQLSLIGYSEVYTIDITKYNPPTNLYANDLENQFRGFNGNLEYSDDNAISWIKYDPQNTRITGDKNILIRYASSGTKMQSESVQYIFREDNQADTRKYIQLNHISLYSYSSQQNNNNAAAANMIDGNINTGWHNTWAGEQDKYYSIKFDKPHYITSIEYKPSGGNGTLKNVDIYTSMDGLNWVKNEEVRGLANNANIKNFNFSSPTITQYIKLQAINTYGNPVDVFFTGKMLNFFEDITQTYLPSK